VPRAVKYEVFMCPRCGDEGLILKSYRRGPLCSICETRQTIEALDPSQQERLRDAAAKGISGMGTIQEVLRCSLGQAQVVLYVLHTE
jgi:hypothetical protein